MYPSVVCTPSHSEVVSYAHTRKRSQLTAEDVARSNRAVYKTRISNIPRPRILNMFSLELLNLLNISPGLTKGEHTKVSVSLVLDLYSLASGLKLTSWGSFV